MLITSVDHTDTCNAIDPSISDRRFEGIAGAFPVGYHPTTSPAPPHRQRPRMKIRFGYELTYDCPQPTPMILVLNVHYSRISDLIVPDHLRVSPSVPVVAYRDGFGNWCSRIVAPRGQTRLTADGVIRATGELDPVCPSAEQHPVEALPDDTLVFLLASRFCETDRLSQTAWSLFGASP